jgi:hypothetical protein
LIEARLLEAVLGEPGAAIVGEPASLVGDTNATTDAGWALAAAVAGLGHAAIRQPAGEPVPGETRRWSLVDSFFALFRGKRRG